MSHSQGGLDGAGGGVRVLYVDEVSSLGELVGRSLEREGADVVVETASDVAAALAVLESTAIDCVVSEYDLPDRDGLDLLRAVREHHGDLPFVLFTGGGSEAVASEAISAGVDDYLTKPSGAEQYGVLADRVEALVEGRRAAEQVAASTERYHGLVDTAPTPVALFDEDTTLVYVNDAGVDLLGYEDAGAMVGMELSAFVHPDDRERARGRFSRLVEAGGPAPETELRLLTADGEVRHVRVATAPGAYDGEFVAQAALRDVTEFEAARSELAAERQLLEQAVDTIDDVFYVLDTDGRFERWNDRLNEVTGLSDAEIAETSPLAFFPEGEAERVAAAIEEVLVTGNASVVATAELLEGEVPYEFRGRRLTDEDGAVVGLCGIGRDVSERTEHESALRALNDVATDVSGYTDREAVCERVVEAAETVLDHDLSIVNLETDGRLPVTALSSEAPPDGASEMSVEEGLAGQTYREGASHLVADLREHDAADPQGPYRSAISVPVGEHGVFQTVDERPGAFDETDLELVELLVAHCESALDRIDREAALEERTERLREQNERLEEFAGIVSHDLRNPLNLVQVSVELARETGDEDYLVDCEDAVAQMDALIDDLLTLAREGAVVEGREPVDVGDVVRECWATLGAPSATLELAAPPSVDADPARLRQALENLLDNAVEHAGPAATVRVGAIEDDPGFYVADDGPGLACDDAAVFEAGFTTSEDGTGLGLHIVEQVVEGHGWRVAVGESDAGGARFEVRTDGDPGRP